MDTSLRPRMAATMPACRAVVAVRRHEPEREAAMLRALRVLHFSGWLLDDPETLAAAAERAGLEPTELEQWLAEPETEALLAEDLAQANLVPEMTRRDDPESVAEVLEWAGEPLATAEIAAVCEIDLAEAREQLGQVADEEHIGADGLWALEPVAV
jgi:hypothetical protein